MDAMARASVRQLILETRLPLETSIDFVDLERCGVLKRDGRLVRAPAAEGAGDVRVAAGHERARRNAFEADGDVNKPEPGPACEDARIGTYRNESAAWLV